MPGARNIKPAFFANEFLAELPCEARLLFIGLWTLADRRGRLEDRSKGIMASDSYELQILRSIKTHTARSRTVRYRLHRKMKRQK